MTDRQFLEQLASNYNKHTAKAYDSVMKAIEEDDYDGAAGWFGHADDAYDAGLDQGENEVLRSIVEYLEGK